MQENQISPIPTADSLQTTVVEEVEQQPKKNNFLVNLLSTLLFISIVIAGFFAYQTQKLAKELQGIRNQILATPTPELESTSLANWKTYTSPKFNFSFKYPSELSYIYDQSDQYSEAGPNNAMILIQNFDGSKPRTETDSDFQIVVYIYNTSGQANLEDSQGEKTKTVINGISVTKTFTTQKWILVPTAFFESKPNKIAVQLSYPKSTNSGWFDQILSTFKFTN